MPSPNSRKPLHSIPIRPTFTTRSELPFGSREISTRPQTLSRAAIQAKPDYAEAHYTLGTVLKQQGKLPEAAASLREAIRLQPDFAGAHTTLADHLRQLGDAEGAARESRLGAQISKDKTNLQAATFDTNSGMRLLKVGDLEGAISQFRAAIALAPTYAPAHFHLAEALRQKVQTEEASQEFQRAAELDPQLKPQRRNLVGASGIDSGRIWHASIAVSYAWPCRTQHIRKCFATSPSR